MIFASFHQGKEGLKKQLFTFLCHSINHTTCVSRLEAAPTNLGVSLRGTIPTKGGIGRPRLIASKYIRHRT
jgi:hypothetical protein